MPQRPVSPGSRLARAAWLAAALLLWTGCSEVSDRSPTGPDAVEQPASGSALAELARSQDFGMARVVARARTPSLLSIPGVVGTAVGLNAAGRPAVKVFLSREGVEGVPERVDGIPVSRVVTGLFVAGAVRTASTRPAPVGFSVGHPDITAGTLGARVTDGTNVYILSNNHVIANSNGANIGDAILQPGPVDGGTAPDDVIGTLSDFEPIAFNGSGNTMDAAIAQVDPADVSGATPTDEGYGAPGTTVTPATLGMNVQKYGRTTGHTFGQVTEVDVTVNVCYAGRFFCTSLATFTGQIGISDGNFSAGGDSGSLIVTDDGGRNPVGLLFAGSSTRTLANPIGPVLQRFGVSIDPTVPGDGGGGGGGNAAPTASFTSSCTELTCSFDASNSSDSDGTVVSYAWDFGDGTSGSGVSASRTYASGGAYTVTLTVTDDGGATGTASEVVTATEPATGGDSAPAVDQVNASARTSGPWTRADVAWSVSDADGDLAQVRVELLDGSGGVLDSVSTSVSGSNASGTTSVRTRNGSAASVRVTVTDGNGNSTAATAGL